MSIALKDENGLMTVEQPIWNLSGENGLWHKEAGDAVMRKLSCQFTSQPKGILKYENVTSGYTKLFPLSQYSPGAELDTADTAFANGDVVKIEYHGKCSSMQVNVGLHTSAAILIFDGSGSASAQQTTTQNVDPGV